MKNSIKEHLAIFGCFLGLYILQLYQMRFVVWLVRLHSNISYVAAIFVMISFAILVVVLYIRWAGRDKFSLNGISWRIWLYTFLLCFSHWLLVWTFYGHPICLNESNFTYGTGVSIPFFDHIILSFNSIFCRPIYLVILFRGLLQNQLSKNIPGWISIAITTILISLGSIKFLPDIFPSILSGIFVGIIYHKTDKLTLCIIYQSLYNLVRNTTIYSFEKDFTLFFFVLAVFLLVYALRGIMKYQIKKKNGFATSIPSTIH